MLVVTEVKKRTELINDYILSLKGKVYDRHFEEASELLKKSRESINNSYMLSYDPNSFILDSLVNKNENLKRQKLVLLRKLTEVIENINGIKEKRGFTLENSAREQSQGEGEFVEKMGAEGVGAYASRPPLKLSNVNQVEYEQVNLQTDFHVLKIHL
jgi:hypothetical protein